MKKVFLFLIPVFALLYGTADYLGICDNLSGRTLGQHGYERLRTLQYWPNDSIFRDDKDFHSMMKF
ncbi:MAG: hypothetical protein WC047_09025, partial [Kiritimatiellales bacterium]